MGGRGGAPNATTNKPSTKPAAAPATPATPTAEAINLPGLSDLENQILTNYYKAHTDWIDPSYVSIYDLHNTMPGVPMETFQNTLKSMDRRRLIQLSPYNDQKNLDHRERAAGFVMGGQRVTHLHPIAVSSRKNKDPRPDLRTPINPNGMLPGRG